MRFSQRHRDVFPATIATQHYARGVAYASKAWFQKLKQNKHYSRKHCKILEHNNFMYQDPNDGPSILNVNASILEAEIERFLEASRSSSI